MTNDARTALIARLEGAIRNLQIEDVEIHWQDRAEWAAAFREALTVLRTPAPDLLALDEMWRQRIAALAAHEAKPDPVRAFVSRVNARAEADMLAGGPITGAHHRAIEAELAAHEMED